MSNRLNRKLQDLLKKMEPQVAAAFQRAVANIINSSQLNRIISAIERNDINAAIRAIDLDGAAYAELTAVVRSAYAQAGAVVVANTVWRGSDARKIVIYWNATNPRAERWLTEVSSQFVTRITNEMREVIRGAITSGYAQGLGPRQIALDLVGRVGAGGRREGGVIGLSRPQYEAATHMRDILRNNPARYFIVDKETKELKPRFTKRDKRFDGTIKKAILEGRQLTDAEISKITGRYADRLLKLRGDTIARTETAQAVEAARQEAFEQWKDKTGISDQFITRRWDHAGGGKSSRDWHVEMNGMTVQGLDTPFITPRGARLMYPCDTSLGAGAAEVCNCRCQAVIEIDYKAMAI